MGDIVTDLKAKFKGGGIVIQLIYINVGVFLLTSILSVFFLLFKLSVAPVLRYLELPASLANFIRQPWSILTYMFMHADVFHILFNMLWLYWFGGLFLYMFTSKHLRSLYLFGGICGGVLYMAAYTIFPYFREAAPFSFLLGASASVLAIVTATAYKAPDYRVNMLLIGAVKLKYLALFMVVSDLLFITSANAGGHIAHLGGALGGLLFAMQFNKGRDVTGWINDVWNWTGGLFYSKPKQAKTKMKVHRGGKMDDYTYNANKKAKSEEIDRILDKLKKSGYDNLTSEEKKKLFDASKN